MKTREELINLGIDGYKADQIMLLEKKMLEQAVKFAYTKKDGSLREAEGTLDPKKMIMANGEPWTPNGEPKPEVAENLRYWDLGAKMWREMKVFNLVTVEG